MTYEIEHKYLVDPAKLPDLQGGTRIVQSYPDYEGLEIKMDYGLHDRLRGVVTITQGDFNLSLEFNNSSALGKVVNELFLSSYVERDGLSARLILRPEDVLRFRIKGEQGYITFKGHTGDPAKMAEFELPVSPRTIEELATGCKGCQSVSKTRYEIEYDGFVWEVDHFDGDLDGFVMAEIELPDVNTSYQKPGWAVKNVTDNKGYSNKSLARNGLPSL